MRIRTQIIVTMILFGTVLLAISISAITTSVQVKDTHKQNEITTNIMQNASELSYLVGTYVVNQEDLQLERLQTSFTSLSDNVSKLQVVSSEEQELVRNIQEKTQVLKDDFDSVATAFEGEVPSVSSNIDTVLLKSSLKRIAAQSQELLSDASNLSLILSDRANSQQRGDIMLIIALAVIFVAFFLVNYLITQRRILKEIEILQTGSAIIGAGNLDFRIEEKKNDEIGELSQAFNRMTANLRNVTATKTELENEIKERKNVEDTLKESKALFQGFFESPGIMRSVVEIVDDTTIRHIIDNPVTARFIGLAPE